MRLMMRGVLTALMGCALVSAAGCAALGDLFGPSDPAEYFDAQTVALLEAADDGDTAEVERLVAQGADIEALSNDHDPRRTGISPLQWAVEFGSTRTVTTLLAAGADALNETAGGYNAVSYAVLRGKRTSVEALLDAQPALIDAPNRNGNGSILHTAARGRDEDMIDLLIERGVNLDATEVGSRTPLFTAAAIQDVDLCLRLIEAGADGGHRDDFGTTFLSGLYGPNDDIRTGEFLRKRNKLEQALRDRGFPVEPGR